MVYSDSMENYTGEEYYNVVLCAHVDKSLQFAYALVLNKKEALKLVQHAYKTMAGNLPLPSDPSRTIIPILEEIWLEVYEKDPYKNDIDEKSHALYKNVLSKLNLRQRAVLFLCDYLGFKKDDCLRVVAGEDDIIYNLAIARKSLMQNNF